MKRRAFLKISGSALINGAIASMATITGGVALALPPAPNPRRLALVNTHTGDAFNDAYWAAGDHVPDALRAIGHVMRDHRSGEDHAIDPRLLDLLHDLHASVGASAPYQIISGYRSPATNAALHAQTTGVASRSLHMDGRAIDIRISGIDLPRLRDAAIQMRRGGVGFYPDSDFIHVDTGRVRTW